MRSPATKRLVAWDGGPANDGADLGAGAAADLGAGADLVVVSAHPNISISVLYSDDNIQPHALPADLANNIHIPVQYKYFNVHAVICIVY